MKLLTMTCWCCKPNSDIHQTNTKIIIFRYELPQVSRERVFLWPNTLDTDHLYHMAEQLQVYSLGYRISTTDCVNGCHDVNRFIFIDFFQWIRVYCYFGWPNTPRNLFGAATATQQCFVFATRLEERKAAHNPQARLINKIN